MSDLIEVKVDSLRVSLTNQQRIIVLKQVDDDRYLPIWIGPYESEAITIALQEVEISRPQTHDLVKNAIELMEGRIMYAAIKDLKDDIFYGVLRIALEDREVELDSRPSDAIAIAIRAHVPIFASKKVMEEASIIPEEIDADEETPQDGEETPVKGGHTRSGKDRLSIFAEYLNSKDAGDESEQDDEDELDGEEGNAPEEE
jgi:bifunctional DNase/RNase